MSQEQCGAFYVQGLINFHNHAGLPVVVAHCALQILNSFSCDHLGYNMNYASWEKQCPTQAVA